MGDLLRQYTVRDAECVKRMLETVDAKGDTSLPSLHHAARGENVGVIRLLLASSICTNSYRKTPSELADPDTEARRILGAYASAQACPFICFDKQVKQQEKFRQWLEEPKQKNGTCNFLVQLLSNALLNIYKDTV